MLRRFLAVALTLVSAAAIASQTRLLRYPDIFQDQVVFTHGGDLWLCPIAGGTARRLTSTPGVELFAKFSPDGRWIAFTGQLHGDEQVCIVPSAGGEIRQLTWYPANGPLPARWGYDNQVYGWSPDGTAVLFRSLRAAWTLTAGKLGYMHLPDMGQNGMREFIKQYYPQRDKLGLVIDDRYNGGGNISEMVIQRLNRELMLCTFGRTSGFEPYPRAVFHGHMVCLLNETSASDGDIFPAMFRRNKLAKLIGKRSWGGIIGITNRGTLMDGGTVNVPEFGNTEPGPNWTIEGYGVDPDIEVDNDVASVLRGEDKQLQAAVSVLLEQIQANPPVTPTAPPAPVKTGR